MIDNLQQIKLEAQCIKWREDPALFVREVIGANPDNQQTELLNLIARLFKAKCKVKAKKPLTSEEEELSKKTGITIMSGKGTGKTALLAWVALWFLALNSEAKVPVTGPSYDQIRDIFMAEFNKWYNRSKLKGALEVQSDAVFVKKCGEVVKNWFLKLRTANKNTSAEQQAGTLAGWHEDYLLVIADEASDVPDPVFSKFDTTLTKPVNFVIMAFNPNRTTGFAYNTHFHDPHEHWIKIHWSAEKSDQVTPQQLENMKLKYGTGSNEYRISVLGLPPTAEKDALIPMDWITASYDRHQTTEDPNNPTIAGIDVAREGVDKTSVVLLRGKRVTKIIRYNEPDSMANADKILEILRNHKVKAAAIDAIGIGGPVYDYIKRQFKNIRPVDVHKLSAQPQRFALLRDELWWGMRELFQNGLLDIPNDRELVNELSNIRYASDTKGRIKVESKKEMKGRGCPSPDSADAILVTQTIKNILTNDEEYAYKESVVKKPHRYSWMGV